MTTLALVAPAVDAPFPIFVYVKILCDELRCCFGVGYDNDMICSDAVSILGLSLLCLKAHLLIFFFISIQYLIYPYYSYGR